MKDTKYIIKRIIIGVGIALILTFIRSFLIVNVYAEEAKSITSPIFYLPKGQKMRGDINKNAISYNYQISESTPLEIRYITGQSSTKLYPSLQEDYPYYAEGITNNTNFQQKEKYFTLGLEQNHYLEQLTFTTYSTSNEYIKKDMKYSILIKITKPDAVKYYDENSKTNIENVDINYFKILAESGAYQTDISQDIEITKFQYIKSLNKYANKEGQKRYTNESYILIEYRTKESLEENTYRLTNQTISFSINKWDFIEGEEEYFFKNDKYFLENDTSQNQEIHYNFAFLEGGYTEFCGIRLEETGPISLCGMEYNGNMDIITPEDEEIFDKYETCEPLDIACHVRNIITALKNIFVRIGNGIKQLFTNIIEGIKSLFTPDFEEIKETYIELKDTLEDRIGFIGDTFDLLLTIINKFLNINDSNGIVNIPQINVPIFNQPIIQAQTWNLKEIFENGAIGTFYNIYKMFVSVILSILMFNYFKKEYDRVIRGGDKT